MPKPINGVVEAQDAADSAIQTFLRQRGIVGLQRLAGYIAPALAADARTYAFNMSMRYAHPAGILAQGLYDWDSSDGVNPFAVYLALIWYLQGPANPYALVRYADAALREDIRATVALLFGIVFDCVPPERVEYRAMPILTRLRKRSEPKRLSDSYLAAIETLSMLLMALRAPFAVAEGDPRRWLNLMTLSRSALCRLVAGRHSGRLATHTIYMFGHYLAMQTVRWCGMSDAELLEQVVPLLAQGYFNSNP